MASIITLWIRERPTLWKTFPITMVPRPTGVLRALFMKPNRRSKTTDIPLKADVNSTIEANCPQAR